MNKHLKYEDWQLLIKFTASQIVRTPAFYLKNVELCKKVMPNIIEKTLFNFKKKLESGEIPKLNKGILESSRRIPEFHSDNYRDNLLPIKINIDSSEVSDMSLIKLETVIGRDTWLFAIHCLLTNTIKVLMQHKWCIFHAPDNVKWTTSDNPVICLNYYSDSKYNFGGGWGVKGSEIIFPLSPSHILYTQVGRKNIGSYKEASFDFSQKLQKIIAEHSHRLIFSKFIDDNIRNLRPRIVSEEQYKYEQEEWRNFHKNQQVFT